MRVLSFKMRRITIYVHNYNHFYRQYRSWQTVLRVFLCVHTRTQKKYTHTNIPISTYVLYSAHYHHYFYHHRPILLCTCILYT